MGVLGPRVLDVGLSALDAECDAIYVCSSEPTTYSAATTAGAVALGSKSFTQGSVFGAPGAGSPDGRTTASVAITNGNVTNSGTISHWAAVDSTTSRLLARGAVTGGVAVTGGQTFTLEAITVNLSSMASSGAEAAAFLARTTGLDGGHITAYTDLINGLVSSGIWALTDILYIFATNSEGNALLNLKSANYPGVIVGSGTHTTDRGYELTVGNFITAGTGGSSYFYDTGGGQNFQQNAASLGAWCVTEVGTFESVEDTLGSSKTNLFPNYSGSAYARINDATPAGGAAVSDGLGFFLGVRVAASGAGCRTSYKNGASLYVGSDASTTPPAAGPRIGQNDGQIACVYVGGNIDSLQGTLYTLLRAYMTAVGVP